MIHKEFDLVISGGGICAYGHLGPLNIIKNKEKNNEIKVRTISATSAGVIVGLFYLTDMSYNDAMQSYELMQNINKDSLHESLMVMLRKILPKDIHIRCNKRLKITLTKINYYGLLQKMVIDEFDSFDHLMLIVEAAVNIPFLINEYFTIIDNERYFDGGIVSNVPIDKNNIFPQLVMITNQFEFPFNHRFNLKSSIEDIYKLGNDGLNKFNNLLHADENNEIYYWHSNKNSNINTIIIVNLLFFILS
jgi:predicted acylesterase/phospholipase RssA